MKAKIFAIISIFVLFSCKKEVEKETLYWDRISERVFFQDSLDVLKLRSGQFSYEIPKSKLPFKKVVLMNASLVGYFTELNATERIAGVSSPEYIYSDEVVQKIEDGTISDVGNEQKYIVEKIIALKPDAVFTNHIANFSNTYELLKKNGIEVIFLDEYLESKPLEKSKYLLAFGKLLGLETEATTAYKKIEKSYDSLCNAVKNLEKPTVLANEMYGGSWFLPGGKTQFANFVKDAGADYILKDNPEEKAVPVSFEEVFTKAENAQFWVNAGNHKNRTGLLSVNPNYASMKVFSQGKIYTVTGREDKKANDFFESGVVRSDVVLKDYIKIFHPEVLLGYNLTYMRELK